MEQRLVLKRAVWSVLIACFSTFLCFVLLHYSKASVAFSEGVNTINPEIKEQIERNLNLDKPLFTQYKIWLLKVLKGDFGESFISGEKVVDLLKMRLFNTLILTLSALGFLFVFSIILSLLSLVYRDKIVDKIINLLCISFFALPSFALCLIFILIFGAIFQILPVLGTSDLGFEQDFLNRISHLILPMSVLVLSHLAVFVRIGRNALIESFGQNFVLNAYARGLSKTRIYLHFVLKYALNPIITYFGASALSFIMGAYVIESVFSYAGVGELLIKSIIFKDYPVVLALIFISVLLVSFFTFLADFLNRLINPRLNKVLNV